MANITPHTPSKLPTEIDYATLMQYIVGAHRALASMNATLKHIPNTQLFTRTFTTKEAVLSSRIEGTVATLSEVLAFEADGDEDPRNIDDILEVLNYRHALEFGISHIKDENPLTENFIKKMHGILLQRGRGQNKSPGDFRRIQVYIGAPGSKIEDAKYIPPEPQNIIPAITNLMVYVNGDDERDQLVRAAVAHYQFEAIHPFLDGNGRVGRLLIMLQLIQGGVLDHPSLYLSEYFEKNRGDYYDTLNAVSTKGDYTGWIRFFLAGIEEQARNVENTALAIMRLYEEYKLKIEVVNSKYAIATLDAIFKRPVFDAGVLAKEAGISNGKTLHTMINKFLELGYISVLNPNIKRGKLYVFKDLIDLTNSNH
jgi:Fic family protein